MRIQFRCGRARERERTFGRGERNGSSPVSQLENPSPDQGKAASVTAAVVTHPRSFSQPRWCALP
jgi:hypothetical protein